MVVDAAAGVAIEGKPMPCESCDEGEGEGGDGISRTRAGAHGQQTIEGASASIIDLTRAIHTLTTLDHEIASSPGVRVRRTGGYGAPTLVMIRGSDPTHTRVLIDGVPIHGAHRPAFDLSLLPAELFGSVTVYRGATSPQLGPPAAGGTIDLHPRFGDDGQSTFSVSGGSFFTRRVSISDHRRLGGVRLAASATYRGSRANFPYRDDGGTPLQPGDDHDSARRRGADFDDGAILVRARTSVERWRLTALTLLSARDAGVPGVGARRTHEVRAHDHRVVASIDAHRPRLANDTVDLGLVAAAHFTRDRFVDPRAELAFVPTDTTHGTRATFLAARPTYRPHPALSVELVADHAFEQRRTRGTSDAPTPATRHGVGGGVRATLALADRAIRIYGGTRGDLVLTSSGADDVAQLPDPRDDNSTSGALALHNPSLGLAVYAPLPEGMHAHFFASWSSGDRVPTFDELYGGGAGSVGNPSLTNEHRVGYDLGGSLGATTDHLSAHLSYAFFDRTARDLIVRVENGAGRAVSVNIGRAALRGHEAALALGFHDYVGVESRVELLDALDRSPGDLHNTRLPFRPRWSTAHALWGAAGPMRVTYNLTSSSAFFYDRANLRSAPRRLEHGVEAGVAHASWRLVAQITNLTDRRVDTFEFPDGDRTARVERAIVDTLGYPLPGRAAFVTLTYTHSHRQPDAPDDAPTR